MFRRPDRALGLLILLSTLVSGAAAAESQPTEAVKGEKVKPRASVSLADVPHRAATEDLDYRKFIEGQTEKSRPEVPVSDEEFDRLILDSLRQGIDESVQIYDSGQSPNGTAPVADQSFKSIDYSQSQQGTPPDPDIMVGSNHIVVGVNTSFQVFDKTGTSVVGPTLYSDFWGSNCGNGSGMVFFDPYSAYDEAADRYVLGITAYDPGVNGGDNGWACVAVSQTGDPTGTWWLYSFDGNLGAGTDYFFDYPHIGVGQDALYLGANMFGSSFVRNHLLVLQKGQMYIGGGTSYFKIDVSSAHFTLQPAKLKGFSTGGWPTDPDEPHYYVSAQWGNNQNQLDVSTVTLDSVNPWGVAPTHAFVGSVTVNTYSLPVSQPQLGGSSIQANDDRLLDVEYWGGRLWATHTIGCNPGGGTVACLRWYEIDISGPTPSLVQQGTFTSEGEYRSFPDLAVDRCGNMVTGYTKTSSAIYPGVFLAGREIADPAGQLKAETTIHAGESSFTCYDSAPRRWGDYTGAALDPDGVTVWYLGEYSTNVATCRWGTWTHGAHWGSCNDDFALAVAPPAQEVCRPADGVYNVSLEATGGFATPTTLAVTGLPAGMTAAFATNPLLPSSPAAASQLTIGGTGSQGVGQVDFTVSATGSSMLTTPVSITIADLPSAPVLLTPADGVTEVGLSPVFSWTPGLESATSSLEVATDSAFSAVVYSATGLAGGSHHPPITLAPATQYFWRVTGVNQCGSELSSVFSLTTGTPLFYDGFESGDTSAWTSP